jgi:Glycosyltransferase family 87
VAYRVASDDNDVVHASAGLMSAGELRGVALVGRALELLLFVALPLGFTVMMLSESWRAGSLAIDLNQTLLPAAERLLHGHSPYPAYGYPPLVAFVLVPFALIPAADIAVVVLLIASVPAILWLVGVRDWRCYGISFLWAPVFSAIQTANVTLPIMLFLALCWRFGSSARIGAVAGGAAVAAKILAWPALLWFAFNRGWKATAGVVGVTFLLSFGLWAFLGFDGLFGYPSGLDNLGEQMAPEAYTFAVLASDLGAPSPIGKIIAAAVVLALLAGMVRAGLKGRPDLSFALMAATCIFASPITWLHSFAFLLLVVAVRKPRLGPVWFLPLPMLFASGTGNGAPWQTALVLCIALGMVIVIAVDDIASRRAPAAPAGRSAAA